jgi:hypothetical protein
MTSTGTQNRTVTRPTGWTGWITFAAVMLLVIGAFNAIDGLTALLKDEVFVTTNNRLLVFDLTTWGWITLLFGATQFLIGLALTRGAQWARVSAVLLVALNAVAQLTFLTAYPLWSTIIIALDVIVIWALVVHGDELSSS